MPEVITQNTSTPAPAQDAAAPVNPLDLVLARHGQTDEPDETDDAAEQEEQDEKKLNQLLRKCEKAFCKGNKGLLLSRVECGKWCHEIYVLRQEQGYKERGFTSTIIFNRLAVHADSKEDCNGDKLANMYKTVEMLATADNWKSLTIGKLAQLAKLVQRVEGTEIYGVFKPDKQDQGKALFAWACGEGLKKPSIADITSRVLELMDPVKHAEREQKKADKAAQAAEEGKDAAAEDFEEEEETPAPANIISTDAARPAAPDWKDVPEGMSAQYNEAMRQAPQEMAMVREQLIAKLAKLPVHDVIGWMVAFFKEGCKRNPGHTGDIMTGFARSVAWTKSSVAGLVQGIADSAEDREDTDAILQELSDTIADEYSIFAAMGEDVDEETEAAAA